MKKARGSILDDVFFSVSNSSLSLFRTFTIYNYEKHRQFLARSQYFIKPKGWIGQGGKSGKSTIFDGRLAEFLEPVTPTTLVN